MDDFKKIAVIGLGLMGGSFAAAVKRTNEDIQVIGYDVNAAAIATALKERIIDEGFTQIKKAVNQADLVVVAVPIGQYEKIFLQIGQHVPPHAIVTDLGSVKTYPIKKALEILPESLEFVGGHPMAGSEKSGVEAANPYLFENAYYFLTLNEKTSIESIDKIRKLVKTFGAYPVIINAREHDQIVANISHLPHLTAAILVHMFSGEQQKNYLAYAGGGFRDSTRIASGDPSVWRDIFVYNKESVIAALEALEGKLGAFKEAMQRESAETIYETLSDAKKIRDGIPQLIKDSLPAIYDIFVSVEDKPGIIGSIAQLLGSRSINISEIEIVHSREVEQGAVRVGFQNIDDKKKAVEILENEGYKIAYQ